MKRLLLTVIKWLSRFTEEPAYLNRPDHLPPVGCPLLIEVDGRLLQAHRTGFISERSREMDYELVDGTTITGRYRWTYP